MDSLVGLLGGCVLLGGAGTLATYWEHRRYVTRTYFSAPLALEEALDGPGRHRREEGFMEPEVFEVTRPYAFSNSGGGMEDPEYAAMKAGRELAHAERSHGGRAPQDYVWLKAYRSHVYGSQRFGLMTFIGTDHTVRSFLFEAQAWSEYERARARMMA